jgi:Family of unknown function (DUF6308)
MRCLPSDEAVRAAARRLKNSLATPGLDRAIAGYFNEPGFAGMTFADLGRNPSNEITPDDLLAVALLDITWRPQVVRVLLGGEGRPFCAMLAALPQDTDLWDADDEILKRVALLSEALIAVDGIGRATASKLLARKRPRLCPITDSAVIKAVDVRGRTWDVLRCLLRDPGARADVEALRPAAAAGASLLRILDVAVWVLHSRSAAAQWMRGQAGILAGLPASDEPRIPAGPPASDEPRIPAGPPASDEPRIPAGR